MKIYELIMWQVYTKGIGHLKDNDFSMFDLFVEVCNEVYEDLELN